jgi:GDP-mannose 6-dehydrogenase
VKVIIFGLGYVGFTAACCIARQGHEVIGVDVSARKVAEINDGIAPIVEPEVSDMLAEGLAAGRISARTEIGDALDGADIAIVCVGTPSAADGAHNMGYVADVSRQIARALVGVSRAKPLTVAYRSTFRPGTCEGLVQPIFDTILGEGAPVSIAYNPEFLREGSAVADYFAPPKIVIGTRDGQPDAAMEALHEGIEAPVFHVGYREAEITKFVDNTWHAVKVAFANEIGRTCLQLGISARQVHEIFVSDTKLNISPYYTRPGGAFGGSCLPKDVRALSHIAADTGTNLPLVDSPPALQRRAQAPPVRICRRGARARRAHPDGGAGLQGGHRRSARKPQCGPGAQASECGVSAARSTIRRSVPTCWWGRTLVMPTASCPNWSVSWSTRPMPMRRRGRGAMPASSPPTPR